MKMETYISFLRGVNMTGHNSIKMTDLSELFIKIGFKDSETYIQSGNVVFCETGEIPPSELTVKIEQAILKRFNYVIPVMIRTKKELSELFTCNPFLEEPGFDASKMAVIFLHEEPSDFQIRKVEYVDYPPDKFKIVGKEIYTYCPNGFGKTKIYTNFFEKKMGVSGTARNWKTITTLLGIAEKKI
jgi:uncharacterized protein (DUF1697 family)